MKKVDEFRTSHMHEEAQDIPIAMSIELPIEQSTPEQARLVTFQAVAMHDTSIGEDDTEQRPSELSLGDISKLTKSALSAGLVSDDTGSSTSSSSLIPLPSSCRIPISVIMPLFSLLVSFVVMFAELVVIALDNSVSAFAPIFTDDVINRTAFVVQQHFDYFQKISTITENAMATDYFFDNFWNYTAMIQWFGMYTLLNATSIISLENGNQGYTVSSFDITNPSKFPYVPGYAVLQLNNPLVNYTPVGYFALDTSRPMNGTSPLFNDSTTPGFNLSQRVFFPRIHASRSWSAPFVSVSTSSAAFATGGPILRVVNGSRVVFATYVHITHDIITYLKSVSIFKTGVAMIIDRATRTYIGGNLVDKPIAKISSGASVLVPMANLTDSRVKPIIGSADITSVLMNCPAPCKFVYEASTGILSREASWRSRFLNDFSIVSVTSISDGYGLDLRMVVIIASKDFFVNIGTAAAIGEFSAFCAAFVLSVGTFFLVRRMLRPFDDSYRTIVALTSYCVGRVDGTDVIAARMVASRRKQRERNSIVEVDKIEQCVNRLVKEMMTILSFIPETVKFDNGHLTLAAKPDGYESSHGTSLLGTSPHPSRGTSLLRESIVTYVCGDLRGFHKMKGYLFPRALQEIHGRYISVIVAAVATHGGMLDRFFGDHVYIHFNAAKRLKGHAMAAARMALEVDRRCSTEPNRIGSVAFGIATTKAWCGLMGSQKCLAYAVLGSCVHQAFLLCWGAKLDQRSTYVARSTAQLILKAEECEFGVQHVRAAVLPGESALGLISTLVPRSSSNIQKARDEWDAIETSNAAYVAYVACDNSAAVKLAAEAKLPQNDWLVAALKPRNVGNDATYVQSPPENPARKE